MKFIEFVHPFKSKPFRDLCLAALYYELRYNTVDGMTADEIRTILRRARVPKASSANIPDVLSKGGPYVDADGRKGKALLWKITSSGQEYVREFIGLPDTIPEIEHDVASLEKLAATIKDPDILDYVNEAIKCLSVGALRASVVFIWAGAVRVIQQAVISKKISDVNTFVTRHDPKAKTISKLDDLAYIKESTLLLAAQDLAIFDKNEKDMLTQALDLRNKCGHPGKYKAGVKKVSGFIEDVVQIVFK